MHQGDGAEMICDFLAVDARIALFRCFHRKADDVLVAGLDEQIADVKAHGALLDAEILGDFLVAHVAADALQDLELAARQLGVRASKGGGAADIRIDLCAFHRGADTGGECLARDSL